MLKPPKSSLSRWLLASVFSALLMLFSLSALAGTVQIRDSGGVLTSSDVAALRSEGADYPFDVRVVTSSEFEKKGEFDRYVGAQVGGPNMVVVGLDREHRFTSVHFGTGVGVPPAQYRAIEQAGNSHFREGNWRAGIDAILGQAKQFAHSSGTAAAQPGSSAATTPSRTLAGSTVFLGLIVVLVVAAAVVFVGSVLSRRARAGGFGSQPYPPNMPPGPYPPGAGPYPPGGYGPGYGGGSGIGGNIASAGLGGLVGYELGKMAGERHSERHDEHDREAGMTRSDEREDYDAGGSSGGWDDSGGGDWGGGDGGGGDGGGGSDW